MPGHRWLTPLFYLGTITLLLVLWRFAGFFHAPKWILIAAYLISPSGGFRCVGFYLKRNPEARYVTTDKEDGMGYVWAPMDALVPYLISSLIVVGMILFSHRH